MVAVIAIIGRPNVGKSTLFNRLTGSRDALVADRPGLTRDRQYGQAIHAGQSFWFIDTGGMGDTEHDSRGLSDLMCGQAALAIEEAGLLLWVLDGVGGITAADLELAATFRRLDKPVLLLANKLEGRGDDSALAEFYRLGFAGLCRISAKRGDGIAGLWERLREHFPPDPQEDGCQSGEGDQAVALGVLGRPNVGKSTLVNHILGEQRMLTQDRPGTTRDSVRIPFTRNEQDYVLIDTAGVRRRSRIDDLVERLSVAKALATIAQMDIALFLVDGGEGFTDQDSTLLGLIAQSGKSLIIAINKCDNVDQAGRQQLDRQLARKYRFVDYARVHYISGLRGDGVDGLFKSVRDICRSLRQLPSPATITGILHQATAKNPPPAVRGRLIKLRYAHLGGTHPLRVIIHGNRTQHLPQSYLRYLARSFREQLRLVATPVLVECRQHGNPYDRGT